eukprot:1162132-Pelagomonas_calceolata.AAC.7
MQCAASVDHAHVLKVWTMQMQQVRTRPAEATAEAYADSFFVWSTLGSRSFCSQGALMHGLTHKFQGHKQTQQSVFWLCSVRPTTPLAQLFFRGWRMD